MKYLVFAIGTIILIALYASETFSLLGLIIGFVAIFIIMSVISSNEKEKKEKALKEKVSNELKNVEGFQPSKKVVTKWGLLAVDNNSQKIAIKGPMGKITVLPFEDILSCEVIEDGDTVYKKTTSRTVGRAIVGGALAGGAGAIIGGLSGKEKEQKSVSKLELKILFRNNEKQSFRLKFFDAWDFTDKTKKSVKLSDSVFGSTVKQKITQLNNWKDTLNIIIDSVDKEKGVKNDTSQKSFSSPADDIEKLHDLKVKGIITEEEFLEQKKKILQQ